MQIIWVTVVVSLMVGVLGEVLAGAEVRKEDGPHSPQLQRKDVWLYTETREMTHPTLNKKCTVYIAYLLNRSERDIKIFAPGFVGPIRTHRGSPERAIHHVTPRYDERDFVTLAPNEAFGRSFFASSIVPAEDRPNLSCHYVAYEAGREGQAKAIWVVFKQEEEAGSPAGDK